MAAACAALLLAPIAAKVRPEQLDRGGEWLSWSAGQQATYVDGFITGYLHGSHSACEVAEKLFGKPGKMYRLGDENHPSELPSARCLARMEAYSKARYEETSGPDFSAYADVVSEFYTKHPEYRGIPFVELMKSLSDRSDNTADQLFQMAQKGEIHPLR